MKRFFPFASLFTLLIGMATPVFSATFTVNNTTDTQDANAGNGTCADAGGNCTFRAAVMECNALAGADTIILPAGTYTFTLTGTGEDACLTGDLDVTSNIVVFGANARTTLVNADSLDRILHVQSAGVLEVNNLTLYDGYILGEHGGGIYNEGSITTDQVMLLTSGSQGAEGGLVIAGGWGGGIYNDGTLNMTRTTIGMNACIGMTGARGFIGGGGGGGAGGFGGGIFNENGATVNATNCTFSGNIATGGTGGRGSRWSGGNYTGDGGNGGGQSGAGGIGSGQAGFPGGWGSGGGGSSGSPTSNGGGSIGGAGGFGGGGGAGSGNAFGSGAAPGGPGGTWGGNGQNHCCDAAGGGGGGAGLGGGLFNNGGTLTFVSVTLAENEANGALGGPGHYGGRGAPGNGVGGGIFNLSGTVNISNTLVGQNVASTQNQDLWGTYASTLGYNLVESPGNASLGGTTTGNVTGQNPNLGPLANNGGETNTHRLIPCGPPSPAIDAGTATGTPPLDQRDTARVLITDIGAYESTFIPPPYFLPQDTIFCLGDTIMIDGGANYNVFNWNTGASGRFLEVTAPGTYYIDVQDTNGCPGTDTIIVTNLPVPPVDLGNDSTGCALNDFTLDAGGNYPVYQWQNNTSLSTLQTTGSGLYWVEVTDTNGCRNRDSIVVTSNALPVVNLGADFQICPDAQDTIVADSGFASYLWQDNSTNDTLITIGAGQFWVMVTDTNGCTDRDTIELTNYPAPTVITSNDPVEICPGGTGTITAAAFAGYLWSDNSTADTLLVTGPGQYTLAATDANGCTWLDTINVVEVPVVNSNILGDSLEFCSDLPDDPILSATGTYTSYLWQDTVASPTLTVNQAGDYWIEVIDSNGCIIQDTVVVEFFAVTPFDLGEPQEICPGEMVTLTIANPSPYDSLIWADGTVGPTYVASDSGTFTLAAWFRGCVIEDSARVDTCPSTIFIPNVFTPNGDGNNDFLNFDEENLEVKEIYIYDRWGREVWYSTEEGAYWDGNQNGSPAQEGVYYFTIRYKLLTRTPAEIVEEKGHVTLLR